MVEVRQTETYAKCFRALRDQNAKSRINIRIRRVSLGNFGDMKSVGEGVESCGWTTALATESISCSGEMRS